MHRPHRSFFAYASALLGLLSLLGVACFHYPHLLTSREFRAVYDVEFARHLLLVGLIAAFVLGTIAILRNRNKRIATLGVVAATLAVLVQFILILVTASTSTIAGLAAFPALKTAIQSLPVWAQFLIAVFVADLAQALLHRAYHNIPWLWRFHAVHHSSRELDWLAGSRIHIVEIVLTRSAVLLPLLVLGFSAAAVNAYVILVGLQAVLAHANIGLRFGWLEYLVVLPRYHHWHHAREQDYIDVNYAIHLPLVDMLMGTFKLPPRGQWPDEYGVMKLETVPRGLLKQHLMPFQGGRKYDDHVD